ncbi:WD domain, G-beta repeat [Musa troglodytarum]|uniref:WD domain, G-beta repeat n=1 Tax=Musa troglodytarum TaxID=320322 RepID=A0A9E7HX45_9LILI|nr:WD domain, G-beta repeat [Musa troglodytarum]
MCEIMAHGFMFREEEDDLFFEAREDISSVFDSCPSTPTKDDFLPEDQFVSRAPAGPLFEVWITSPDGVKERRDKFLRWMGMDPMSGWLRSSTSRDGQIQVEDEIQPDVDGIMSDFGSVPRGYDTEYNHSVSGRSREDASTSCEEVSEENSICRIKNSDDKVRSLHGVGSNKIYDQFKRSLGPLSFIQRLMDRQGNASIKSDISLRKKRIGWLCRLGSGGCIADRQGVECNPSSSNKDKSVIGKSGRVKVRPCSKWSKVLSAVYRGQDIKAHDGAILTMKFSTDGQYLASGGADAIVRVWRVMECERTNEISIPDYDPSCIYFTVNDSGKLTLVHADRLNKSKSKSRGMRTAADSACVVIPPAVFRLSEKPVHEFHGHVADVLDLSWSSNKHLLSSSEDKTVRLWQVGSDSCLKVFPHTNYVTCVQYNPIDENYFISGSIDGKVRIWDISGGQVVNWVHVGEIVTAICYRPDGKGLVVGTLTGNCCFYDASGDYLQIESQISLQRKKKSPSKRITGFQFCPRDHQTLMVTSADSCIRVFDGTDLVSKYKGFQNGRSQISASFTADGQHIISASEDSNVYVWSSHDAPISNHVKSRRSCERFFSSNCSIALTWHGFKSRNRISMTSEVFHSQQVNSDQAGGTKDESKGRLEDSNGNDTLYLSPSHGFALGHEFSKFMPKCSATWPEEKLPLNSAAPNLSKSHHNFLKTSCRNTAHAWGQVILTGGRDGWIRSYQNFGLPVHL